MTLHPTLFLLAIVGIATSCGKKEDMPTPLTPTQLLSSHHWLLRSSIESGPTIQTVDLYAASGVCTQDNLLQFATSNTFIYDEGPTKCTPSSPQTRLGLWALGKNDTQLTVVLDGYTSEYTIEELTTTSLKLTMVEMQGTVTAVQKNVYVAVP